MMPGDSLTNFIFGLTVFDVIKWFLAFGLVMYMGFAVVIIRQVSVMSEALPHDPYNGLIKLFGWAHLLMTVLIFVVTILVL